MTGAEVAVTAGGVVAIALVNWWFFGGAPAAAVAVAAGTGPQRLAVRVHGGYEPAEIRVRAGAPVRLEFTRDETNPCSEEVMFPDFGIRATLPTGRTTAVEFTPPAAGTYEFTCGMGMLRGRVVAEAAPAPRAAH